MAWTKYACTAAERSPSARSAPGDGPALEAAHDRLSPQSKYRRFLAPKPHLTEADARYLVQVDGQDHVAMVATPVEDPDRILAVARFVRAARGSEDGRVRDRRRRRLPAGGDRHGLMERLALSAAERGITRFRATVLAENRPAHRLVRGLPGRVAARAPGRRRRDRSRSRRPRAGVAGSAIIAAVPWKLTVRAGPKVERLRFDTLEEALEAAEGRARSLADTAPAAPVDLRYKRFEPVEQVAARIELAGPERLIPSIRGGIDVRGDGSTEAYLGRVRREVVKQRKGETPYKALRRARRLESLSAERAAGVQEALAECAPDGVPALDRAVGLRAQRRRVEPDPHRVGIAAVLVDPAAHRLPVTSAWNWIPQADSPIRNACRQVEERASATAPRRQRELVAVPVERPNPGASGPITGSIAPASLTCTSNQPISGAAARRAGAPAASASSWAPRHTPSSGMPRAEQRGQQLLLVAQPGMGGLLVGVDRAAEHHHGLEVRHGVRGRPAGGDRPFLQLPALPARRIGEHARPGIGLMDDGQRTHPALCTRAAPGSRRGGAASATAPGSSGQCAPSSAQKRGEWSITSRWQTSCQTT